jgi:hypothetical protein
LTRFLFLFFPYSPSLFGRFFDIYFFVVFRLRSWPVSWTRCWSEQGVAKEKEEVKVDGTNEMKFYGGKVS